MLILVRVLIGVYTVAVNVYSFLLVKQQRDSVEEGECIEAVQDGKLFITALLGGAAGIYTAILTLRYRTKSMLLMVFMPIIAVLNGYALFLLLSSDFLLSRSNGALLPLILPHF